MRAATHDPRLRFLLALGCWSAALLAVLRSPLGQRAIVSPFTAWHAVFASGFAGGSPVVVDLSCSGSDVIALSIAALLAYPAPWRRRLSGVALALVWLCSLNLLRIITLVHTAGSPLFLPLHLYIWPAIMIGAAAAFVAGWIWTGQRETSALLSGDFARTRRLIAVTGVLVVGYIAVTPWLLTSDVLQRAAMTLAHSAAALLRAAGQPALAGASTLVVAERGFVVTPECLVTPVMPIYLAWTLVWPREWRTRTGAFLLFVPLFAALGFVRLLTVALPAIVGPPLFLTHGFYQFLIAAILIAAVARWRTQQRSEDGAPAATMAPAFLTAILVGAILASPYTSLIERAAQTIAPPPADTFAVGTPPPPDVQGALAIMPGFQLALLCGLAVAVWGRRAARVLVVLVPVAAVLHVMTLIVAGQSSARFAAETPVTFVRAVSLVTPCLLVATAAAMRLRRAPPGQAVVRST